MCSEPPNYFKGMAAEESDNEKIESGGSNGGDFEGQSGEGQTPPPGTPSELQRAFLLFQDKVNAEKAKTRLAELKRKVIIQLRQDISFGKCMPD
jgi:hypothetical protein